jgi:hypothetical protein
MAPKAWADEVLEKIELEKQAQNKKAAAWAATIY